MSDHGHPSDRMLAHDVIRTGKRVELVGREILMATNALFSLDMAPPDPSEEVARLQVYVYHTKLTRLPSWWVNRYVEADDGHPLTFTTLVSAQNVANRALRIFIRNRVEISRIEEQPEDGLMRWYAKFSGGTFDRFVPTVRVPHGEVSRTHITQLQATMVGVLDALRKDQQ